ncbi:hypothetical protein D3C77_05090 [compost metagenome]
MARRPQLTDFIVDVEGVGSFSFAKRTMKDEIDIQVEYARIIQGVEATDWLARVGGWISTLKVLTVRAPSGWDIDDMDPLDEKVYEDMLLVYLALRAKEDSFRRKPGKGSEEGGQAQVPDDRLLVSPEI